MVINGGAGGWGRGFGGDGYGVFGDKGEGKLSKKEVGRWIIKAW